MIFFSSSGAEPWFPLVADQGCGTIQKVTIICTRSRFVRCALLNYPARQSLVLCLQSSQFPLTFVAWAPFYWPLLERLPWSSLPFECHMTGCYSGQPPPSYRYFCTFHHETIGRASFHNLFYPGLEVYISSLQFSNMEMYIWKAQPDLISTDSLTHCERIFHTGPQWP